MARVIFTLLVTVALCALVYGAPFTAKFKLAGSIQNSGQMTGTMEYDAAVTTFALKYDSNSFKEQFSFNPQVGNFTEQFIYESGAATVCSTCQRLTLKADFPPLGTPAGPWTAGSSITVGGRSCTEYTYNGANLDNNQVAKFSISGPEAPCTMEFQDGRKFTFEAPAVPTAVFDFAIPAGCQCHKRLDLIISLDSSCSIDDSEWAQICDFVGKLVNQFTFGPDAAALALVGYWGSAKVMIPLLDDGAKLIQLTSGVMTRPNGPACGTNVVEGFKVHEAQTFPNLRQGSTPVVLTITDGADAAGVQGITDKINSFKQAPLNFQNFLSVFIGQQTNTQAQMLALAGGDATRTFTYTDFTAFTQAASQIQTAACTSNVANGGCGAGCCGMCMCGTCVTPNSCDDGLKCTTEKLKDTATAGLQCCEAPTPVTCTPTDACRDPKCEEAAGQCVDAVKFCPPKNPNDPCLNESKCDAALGCQTFDKCNISNCDDNNACTLDGVDTTTATCTHSLIPCVASDKCHTAKCDPAKGCVQTAMNVSSMCDDFNVCTADTCDPATGCVHNNNKNCTDASPCTDDSCDPLKGCVSNLKVCPPRPKCFVGVCTEGKCGFQKPPLCKDEIIAVGLTTGAIIGIIIAVIVAAALGAFGIFKGVQAYNASKDLDDSGMNNPLYEMGGKYGESGIYVAAK